jgi:hypothetical protein
MYCAVMCPVGVVGYGLAVCMCGTCARGWVGVHTWPYQSGPSVAARANCSSSTHDTLSLSAAQTRLIAELEKNGAQTVYEPVDKWQEVIPGNDDSNLLVSCSHASSNQRDPHPTFVVVFAWVPPRHCCPQKLDLTQARLSYRSRSSYATCRIGTCTFVGCTWCGIHVS